MCATTLSAAGPMGKGSLPPVFPKDVADKAQFDTRTRAYLSPVRVMWMQNGELIDAAEELPKSFVLTQEFGAQRVYLTKYNAAVLTRRFETARERAAYPFGKEYTE